VFIDGVAVPDTKWVGDGALLAKKGAALKAMCPKGQTVEITVVNGDDGGVSAPAPYTR
jgi:hypothetical protein